MSTTLKPGDKIRILEDGHAEALVFKGDVLTVLTVGDQFFETEAPLLEYFEDPTWEFAFEDEGTGWEKAEEDQ